VGDLTWLRTESFTSFIVLKGDVDMLLIYIFCITSGDKWFYLSSWRYLVFSL